MRRTLPKGSNIPLLHPLQVDGRTKKFGARHAETLDSVNNYALLLHQLGKLEEAEPYSRAKLDALKARAAAHRAGAGAG